MECPTCHGHPTWEEPCPERDCYGGLVPCSAGCSNGVVYEYKKSGIGMSEKTCRTCRGSGKSRCNACYGKGCIKARCQDCSGKGWVPSTSTSGTKLQDDPTPHLTTTPSVANTVQPSQITTTNAPVDLPREIPTPAPNLPRKARLIVKEVQTIAPYAAILTLILYFAFLSSRGFTLTQMVPHLFRATGLGFSGSNLGVLAEKGSLEKASGTTQEALSFIATVDWSEYDLIDRRVRFINFTKTVSKGREWFWSDGLIFVHESWTGADPAKAHILAAHLVFAAKVLDGEDIYNAREEVLKKYAPLVKNDSEVALLARTLVRENSRELEYGIEETPLATY